MWRESAVAHETELLDVYGAAEYLSVHEQTVRRLARKNDIPSSKVGRQWRFDKAALRRWLATHHERSRSCSAHILVVDDEEGTHALARAALEPEGCRVSAASGGAEALDLMRKERPDAVLLDLKMPGMDGPAVLKEIRRGYGDLPVIIITGYPDSDLMARAMEYCPITMLAKPAASRQILASVESVLGNRSLSRAEV